MSVLVAWKIYRTADGREQATIHHISEDDVQLVHYQYADREGWTGRDTLTIAEFKAKYPVEGGLGSA